MGPRWVSSTKTRWLIDQQSSFNLNRNDISTPCRGRLEYFRHSPVSHQRWQKGNPMPRGITGQHCSWGMYIWGPGPPGWGSLRETIKYGYGSCTSQTIEWFHCKLQTLPLIVEGALHEEWKELSNFFSVTLNPQAKYNDRVAAACLRLYCQLLQVEGVRWSA
jgi:hypothetical protein